MEVKLRVVGGKNAGQELPVAGSRFLIGRAEGCQLRAKSPAVAERHCELELAPGLVRLNDLGSTEGTFVNNERVTGSRDLKIGDQLRIGPLTFELCLDAKLAGKKKPKVSSIGEAAARLAGGQQGPAREEGLDLDKLLSDDQDNQPAPSRYAARLSDEEQQALGLKPRTDPAPGQAKPPAKDNSDETRDAAAKLLNKYYKRP
ncbi:MAG TPA: FHA domain-containing protein [Pirellulales bacterium]|jgi:predicted component of type VI protein secretion system|nr:FHA domain-containing protein [Pirellulales bacterium]